MITLSLLSSAHLEHFSLSIPQRMKIPIVQKKTLQPIRHPTDESSSEWLNSITLGKPPPTIRFHIVHRWKSSISRGPSRSERDPTTSRQFVAVFQPATNHLNIDQWKIEQFEFLLSFARRRLQPTRYVAFGGQVHTRHHRRVASPTVSSFYAFSVTSGGAQKQIPYVLGQKPLENENESGESAVVPWAGQSQPAAVRSSRVDSAIEKWFGRSSKLSFCIQHFLETLARESNSQQHPDRKSIVMEANKTISSTLEQFFCGTEICLTLLTGDSLTEVGWSCAAGWLWLIDCRVCESYNIQWQTTEK